MTKYDFDRSEDKKREKIKARKFRDHYDETDNDFRERFNRKKKLKKIRNRYRELVWPGD